MNFLTFHENSHHRNGYFQKISEIHTQDEFVKIQVLILVIIFMFFSRKNDNLGLKMSLQISQNLAQVMIMLLNVPVCIFK